MTLHERASSVNRRFTMSSKASCTPKVDTSLDARAIEGAEADSDLALMSKALGHPARVQILRMLTRKEACICGDIVDEIDLAQSTVSQHLKVLKDAGLVQGTIDGPRVCYCADSRALRRFKALVGGL